MNGETFCKFLRFRDAAAIQRGSKLPEKILLFVDRHPSHLTLDACQTDNELGIILVVLYPNATFILQPADVSCFRALKSYWNDEVRLLKSNDFERNITKAQFADVFIKSFDRLAPQIFEKRFQSLRYLPVQRVRHRHIEMSRDS